MRPSLKVLKPTYSIFLANFKYVRTLYNEKHSTTCICEDVHTHKMVVMKQNTTHAYYCQILREINILVHLKHSGIIKMLEYHISDKRCKAYIILEYIEKGDLYDYFDKYPQYFTVGTAIELIRKLIIIVKYCHESGICHRDIKLENILLNTDNSITLIDFGLSVQKTGSKFIMYDKCGSPDYMAPEVMSDEYAVYDEKCDVWGIGVVLYLIICNRFPVEFTDDSSLQYPSDINPPDDVADLLEKMLCKDPSSRISITDASTHRCFDYAI
jgi:serine/threonine protein kinase